MATILKNTTGSLKTWGGIDVSAAGSYNIQVVDTLRILSDEVFKDDLINGAAVINDGFSDLSPIDAVFFLFAYTPNTIIGGTDGTPIGNSGDRLKLDVQFSGDQLIKVSSNDQSSGYLEAKVIAESGAVTVTTLNDGGDEDLQIGLPAVGTAGTYGSATQVPVITTDAKGRVSSVTNTSIVLTSSAISDFTEAAQDAVGNSLTDSSSVDFTYNDAGNTITAVVLPAGIDHNSLQNYVVNRHIDHSLVSITAGTGLSGGGDITTTRMLNIANTGVLAGSYGSSTEVPVLTVNSQGQITSASTVVVDPNLTANIVASTTLISTTSTAYVTVTGMSVSLPAGTYMVTGKAVMSTTSNSRYINLAIFQNGTINTNSEIFGFVRTGAPILSNSDILNLYTSTIVTLASTQTIDLRWKTSGGTAQAQGCALTYLKIG